MESLRVVVKDKDCPLRTPRPEHGHSHTGHFTPTHSTRLRGELQVFGCFRKKILATNLPEQCRVKHGKLSTKLMHLVVLLVF